MALWGLLRFAKLWNFTFSHIFGDSLCIINWAIVRAALRPLSLHHWLEKVWKLIHKDGQVVIAHIRRGFNMEADGLSKQELSPFNGRIHYKEFREGILVTDSLFPPAVWPLVSVNLVSCFFGKCLSLSRRFVVVTLAYIRIKLKTFPDTAPAEFLFSYSGQCF